MVLDISALMSQAPSHHNKENWLLLLLLTFIWGSSYILIKTGLQSFTAVELASLRISITFFASLPFVYKAIKTIPKEKYFTVLLIGIFGSGAPAFLFAFSMTHSASAVNGILNSLSPLWTIVVGYFLFQVGISPLKVLGVLLGFAGAVVLVLGKSEGNLQVDVLYSFLPVVATFCYGMSTNITKQRMQNLHPLYSTALAMCMIGIPASVLFLCGEAPQKIMSGDVNKALASVALLSLAGTLLAWVLFYRLVQRTDALFAASVTYLIPIVAVAWGLWFGETLSAIQFGGMALIIAGVYFTTGKK